MNKVVSIPQVQLEKILAPWRREKAESMRGRGYLFLTVILFNPWKSVQGHPFSPTKKKPAPTGEDECLMIPGASDSQMWSSMVSRSGRERLYRLLRWGEVRCNSYLTRFLPPMLTETIVDADGQGDEFIHTVRLLV